MLKVNFENASLIEQLENQKELKKLTDIGYQSVLNEKLEEFEKVPQN